MISFKKEPAISVGIQSEKKISFDLYGEYRIEGLNQVLSGRFSAELLNDKIICKRGNETFEFQNEVSFEPVDPGIESFLIKDVTIGNKFHWERKEKLRFAGALHFIKDNGKWILCLNFFVLLKICPRILIPNVHLEICHFDESSVRRDLHSAKGHTQFIPIRMLPGFSYLFPI